MDDDDSVTMWRDKFHAKETKTARLRAALTTYHALMGNIHALTENPVGSLSWRAWMDAREKAQREAQRVLQETSR